MCFPRTLLFLLLSCLACTTAARSLHTLSDAAVSSKLEPATIKAVFKNSTSEYKFLFPNVPADELDENYNSKFPLDRPVWKQKHSVSDRRKSSAGIAGSAAGKSSKVEIQLQEQETFKSSLDDLIMITRSKNTFVRKLNSGNRKFLVPTVVRAPDKFSNLLTQGAAVSLPNSLSSAAGVTDGQLSMNLSPEQMEEINETGRLCNEDGECIYFGDWGNNCCPFG